MAEIADIIFLEKLLEIGEASLMVERSNQRNIRKVFHANLLKIEPHKKYFSRNLTTS